MTTPSTAKNTPAKNIPATVKTKAEENKSETKSEETTTNTVSPDTASENVSEATKEETPKDRTPETVKANPILASLVNSYLEILDEIAGYNKQVLADKDSEWNGHKVLAKAKEFASPEDATKVKPEIKKLYDVYEDLLSKVSEARKSLIEVTSKELGISLSAVADRDPEIEAKLKDRRKIAVEIGSQLALLGKMTNDKNATTDIENFLKENELPAVGRDQTRSFVNGSGGSAPKYRVKVTVSKDGNVLLEEDGFSKTALALSKPAFGYPRGQALKADKLREAWEAAGNSSDKTVKETVEFDDNGLHFVLVKK